MKITSFSIYSIILLIETAKRNDELFTIRKFSIEQQIPINHIRKIVHVLGVNGYLETIRGVGGGFKLGKHVSKINIGELLRLTEGRFVGIKSSKHSESVNQLKETCNIGKIINEAIEGMFTVFEKYTLVDLLKHDMPQNLFTSEMELPTNKISHGE